MKELEKQIVVEDIAGVSARLTGGLSYQQQLLALGFTHEAGAWTRTITDDADRLSVVSRLIDLGAVFSAGHGWSPEDIVEYYRDKGQILAPYRRIAWSDPDTYRIEEIPPRTV